VLTELVGRHVSGSFGFDHLLHVSLAGWRDFRVRTRFR
jgi:hypothetical protein